MLPYHVPPQFTVERHNKHFCQCFKIEYQAFSTKICGIPDNNDRQSYALCMLLRLIVLYFLQRNNFIDRDLHYLNKILKRSQQLFGSDQFYQKCLLPLFFQLWHKSSATSAQTALLGQFPLLDIDLYQPHSLEKQDLRIIIPDSAFVRFFSFCDSYQWRLDTSLPTAENELHPDILAVIFEQHIDQKQSGAYYTQNDVATYITSHTILPFLLHSLQMQSPEFLIASPLWTLLQHYPERYIPTAIQSTSPLPTETEREYSYRQDYHHTLLALLRTGSIRRIEELTTYNLNLVRLVCDLLQECQDPDFLFTFYQHLSQVTILDPTCGSGAFLFAALTILLKLYSTCFQSIQTLMGTLQESAYARGNGQSIRASFETLQHQRKSFQSDQHFILHTIISNNLYGVELMAEAANICKLHLYLSLLSTLPKRDTIPPFSSITFQVRVGNTVAGEHYGKSGIHPLETRTNNAAAFHWFEEFPDIQQRGGFDVIVGNPPYVEHSKVKHYYTIEGYKDKSCGNLYAAVLERSLQLCRTSHSYIGLIVPISICGSKRFQTLRHTLSMHSTSLWLASFEIFPCRLFEGAFQRTSILITHRQLTNQHEMHVTKLHRWYTIERPHLIELLRYTHVRMSLKANAIPKLANTMQEEILQKLFAKAADQTIGNLLQSGNTSHFIYYQESTNYWVKALCHIPYYKKNNQVMEPPHGRFLFFADQQIAHSIMALLNSSLFYVWFTTYSDGFHLAHALVKSFPITSEIFTQQELCQLSHILEQDVMAHTQLSTRNTREAPNRELCGQRHRIELEEYHMYHSKQILDTIDRALACYYGLNEQELDFLINFDIKHRLHKRDE